MSHTYPIVGMFYRPPAKALVEVCHIGMSLILRREPDNPVDPNAIAVYLKASNFGEAAMAQLDEVLPGFGYTLSQVLEQDEWQLGYIPKEMAYTVVQDGKMTPGQDVPGKFFTSINGKPRIEIESW